MTAYEKAEIKRLPKKYRPISAIGYLFYSILYIIPVIGWIFMIAHASSSKKICRRSFARICLTGFIVLLITIIAGVILYFTAKDVLSGIVDGIVNALNALPI